MRDSLRLSPVTNVRRGPGANHDPEIEPELQDQSMLIGAYGMFWLRDEVDWRPGSGPNAWQLLGRDGERRPKIRVVDFRLARGAYILSTTSGRAMSAWPAVGVALASG